MMRFITAVLFALTFWGVDGFVITSINNKHAPPTAGSIGIASGLTTRVSHSDVGTTTTLSAVSPDLDLIALVVGQENYGLALVAFGEGVYSFLQAPSFSNIKVVVPPAIAAVLLVAVAGPMITSGDAASVGTGLYVATAVSFGLGLSYVLRLVSPPSDTFVPKEVAFVGLLVALAGFFSFSQNLLVDGFLVLPDIDLPTILPMPPSDNGV
mmetsp:Transcript_21360/g.27600  ORF Transcript_21360/g.27600 Transcript_21360/m.27600 type:complete len:210 (+) Transcript_21360:105-734(+)|eukprot:CAMPEP_0198136982 /NCGR_PEP_ID=MMETSP1443-20131203/535_1 /TAXON_ID=186043 /ORGANISM="Entomoneis sp., Strain CCMP2396" /LENGTH=209 /DNA_ID=CAMNT_0043798293 /DNA_START=82 /DNA_END=711 /DNA_ORIENTATION=-